MADGLNFSRRLRRTPYTDRAEAAGVRGFSVVNHMLLPKAYARSVEEDYWHLRDHVQIWDVACQRQVEISGPDAARLVQWMTPRDISKAKVGDCLYVPLVDHKGVLGDSDAIQDDGPDADQAPVLKGCAMHHGSVTNGDVSANGDRRIGISMKNGAVLHVAARANLDRRHIPPGNRQRRYVHH